MPASTPSNSSPPASVVPHAFAFGGVAAVLAAVWSYLEFRFGFYGRGAEMMAIFFPVIAIAIGVLRWRDGALGGRMSFVQGVRLGLAIGLVFSVGIAVFAWVHTTWIRPDLLQEIARIHAEMLQQSGQTVEADAAALVPTAGQYAIATLARYLLISLFVSLIAGAIARRRGT